MNSSAWRGKNAAATTAFIFSISTKSTTSTAAQAATSPVLLTTLVRQTAGPTTSVDVSGLSHAALSPLGRNSPSITAFLTPNGGCTPAVVVRRAVSVSSSTNPSAGAFAVCSEENVQLEKAKRRLLSISSSRDYLSGTGRAATTQSNFPG